MILACLDSSPISRRVLDYALAVAGATDERLRLLTVVDLESGGRRAPVDALALEVARSEAMRYLQDERERIAQVGESVLGIDVEVADGRPASRILEVAERELASLIVLAPRRETDGIAPLELGTTAHKVLHGARRSVLLARGGGGDGAAPSFERILVLLDGSSAAECSLPEAARLARSRGTLVLLGFVAVRPDLPTCEPRTRGDQELIERVISRNLELARSYLRNVERGVRASGVTCRSVIVEADSARDGVLSLADEERVDLLLLTSHGHTSSESVVYGSVAQQILLHSRCAVWLVQNAQIPAPLRDSGDALELEPRRLGHQSRPPLHRVEPVGND